MLRMRSMTPFQDRLGMPRPEFGLFGALHRQIDRLFDDVTQGFGGNTPAPLNLSPSIDVSENDKDIEITAELPGLERKDVDITVDDDLLIIKGEKRIEAERPQQNDGQTTPQGNGQTSAQAQGQRAGQGEGQQAGQAQGQQAGQGNGKRDYHVTERVYGVFYRVLQLPMRVDPSSVQATMSNGVLRIRIPKPTHAEAKKIEVKEAA